ncbi:Ump1p [Rhodotorula paludigena]|uniref:Ump1p n=1 Tax=Rhodotorula paludigena TaxID=86838 RepID=UPI003172CA89
MASPAERTRPTTQAHPRTRTRRNPRSPSHGLHDTLQLGVRSIAADVALKHPLENRIAQWDATRENLEMTLQRNMYGVHAPVRLMMERQLVSSAPTPMSLGLPGSGFTKPGNIHLDILMGRDEEIRPQDVLIDRAQSTPAGDFHLGMERKLRL